MRRLGVSRRVRRPASRLAHGVDEVAPRALHVGVGELGLARARRRTAHRGATRTGRRPAAWRPEPTASHGHPSMSVDPVGRLVLAGLGAPGAAESREAAAADDGDRDDRLRRCRARLARGRPARCVRRLGRVAGTGRPRSAHCVIAVRVHPRARRRRSSPPAPRRPPPILHRTPRRPPPGWRSRTSRSRRSAGSVPEVRARYQISPARSQA